MPGDVPNGDVRAGQLAASHDGIGSQTPREAPPQTWPWPWPPALPSVVLLRGQQLSLKAVTQRYASEATASSQPAGAPSNSVASCGDSHDTAALLEVAPLGGGGGCSGVTCRQSGSSARRSSPPGARGAHEESSDSQLCRIALVLHARQTHRRSCSAETRRAAPHCVTHGDAKRRRLCAWSSSAPSASAASSSPPQPARARSLATCSA